MAEHDKEYEWVAPLPPASMAPKSTRGRQCGECGMKFENHVMMAYYCASMRCPMGWNSPSATNLGRLR